MTIVGIEQNEVWVYLLDAKSDVKVDIPQELADEIDQTFSAFLAAQVKLADIIEFMTDEAAVSNAPDAWCGECGKVTVRDGTSCSECGFPYGAMV